MNRLVYRLAAVAAALLLAVSGCSLDSATSSADVVNVVIG
ncbi:MAG: hypothetical protein JWR37_2775, partial [Mycobacterium sp.]|nr:hypothetical protein [Mycobacterium sp.]